MSVRFVEHAPLSFDRTSASRHTADKSLLWLARLLMIAAFAFSTYLAWVSFSGSEVIGCGSSAACQEVLNSPWAYWFGIPVSVLSAILFLILLAASFCVDSTGPLLNQNRAWSLIILCCLCIVGAAVWFGLLQLTSIHFCPLCAVAHVLGIATVVLLFLNSPLRKKTDPQARDQTESVLPEIPFTKLSFLAAGAVGILILGQTLFPKPTHRVTVVSGGVTVQRATAKRARVQVFDRTIELDKVPMMGSPGSPHVLVTLFDYTCYGCRILHAQLLEAQRSFSNQLAIACLAVPLDAACNPTVTEIFPAHTNACAYARVALTVWRADKNQFALFDQWIFATEYPPSLDDTINFAAKLIGPEVLQNGMRDPWVDEELRRNVAIYEVSLQKIGKHSLPQLLVGTNLTLGSFRRMDALYQLLSEKLGLQR